MREPVQSRSLARGSEVTVACASQCSHGRLREPVQSRSLAPDSAVTVACARQCSHGNMRQTVQSRSPERAKAVTVACASHYIYGRTREPALDDPTPFVTQMLELESTPISVRESHPDCSISPLVPPGGPGYSGQITKAALSTFIRTRQPGAGWSGQPQHAQIRQQIMRQQMMQSRMGDNPAMYGQSMGNPGQQPMQQMQGSSYQSSRTLFCSLLRI